MIESNNDMGSLLGRDAHFEGKLTFLGTVRVEGRFDGEIRTDHTLVVGDGAHITGKVEVGNLIITGGIVEAEVTAAEAVELHPPGRLSGHVTTPSLQIERGAVFTGQSNMTSGAPSESLEPIELPDSK